MTFHFPSLSKPIIQAPMAGGITTPALVAAVANAGGVGSFGFAYSSPQKIHDDLLATKALTNGAINANFFVFKDVALPNLDEQQACIEALSGLSLQGEYLLDVPKPPFFPDLDDLLAPIWEHRPQLLTFHFGIPSAVIIKKAHELNISIGVSATSVEEATLIAKADIDFIVAQGVEAGGHRGFFDIAAPDLKLHTIALVQEISKHMRIPVVAAGGIMDGGDIRRTLNAGAVAAQMGTAFLCCPEACTSAQHKHYVLHEKARGTAFTRGFSGRLAQGIANTFIKEMQDKPALPFPIQNTLTASLRQLANRAGDGEFQSLWAGAHYHRARQMPASELMDVLYQEYLHSA